ncbi:MAG: site-2 protease family protein [Deltaproteobacteria bacterium]|nr:site-2 protease family protein [Deltaproteobacteria bacterium]
MSGERLRPEEETTPSSAPVSAEDAAAPPGGLRRRLGRLRTPLDIAARFVAVEPQRVFVPLVLFLLTVLSTLYVGRGFVEAYSEEVGAGPAGSTGTFLDGWPYALPLLSILLCHEMGHYVAARIHGIPVSLPYFIPIPIFFGTFGAVIRTRGQLRSRRALLDVGAAGPLAGMIVAIPCMIAGLALSEVRPLPTEPYQLEGVSLLYGLLKWLVVGPVPAGHDVFLHPLAWAAWIGFLVTMINLIPVGQLDGGHVAYALFGGRYRAISQWAHRMLVVLGVGAGAWAGGNAIAAGKSTADVAAEFAVGANWLVWALILWILNRATKGHPPVDEGDRLSPLRVALGTTCVLLFLLLFMPVPLRAVTP